MELSKNMLYEKTGASVDDLPFVFKIPSIDFAYGDGQAFKKMVLLLTVIMRLFKIRYDRELDGDDGQIIMSYIFSETVKNGAEHGNAFDAKKYVTVEIWFGSQGMVFSFQDEGDYFKKPEVKKAFEAREEIESTSIRADEFIRGAGTGLLFKAINLVYVSNEENKLFLGHLFEDPF